MIDQYFFNILRMSVISFILICVILLISRFSMEKFSIKWRYYSWILILTLMIIPINFEINELQDKKITYINIDNVVDNPTVRSKSRDKINPIPNIVNNISIENSTSKVNPYSSLDKTLVSSLSIEPIVYSSNIVKIWFLGCIVALITQVLSYIKYLFRLRRWSYCIEPHYIMQEFDKVKNELTIKKNVRLKICEEINSPMLIGPFKPTIYLPNTNYNFDELQFIFSHELIHYKRKDIWLKLLVVIVRIVYWFNPFSCLLSKLISNDIELCCDEDVVRSYSESKRIAYIRTILNMMKSVHKTRFYLSINFIGGKYFMKKRIENLISLSKVKKSRGIFIVILLISFLLLNLIACNKVSNNSTNHESSTNVIKIDEPPSIEEDANTEMSLDEIMKKLEDLDSSHTDLSANEATKQIEEILKTLDKQSPNYARVDLSNINYISSESFRNKAIEEAVWERHFEEIYNKSNIPEYKYYYNYIDLNQDGKDEVIVMLAGKYFSSNGGSTGVIFEINDATYTIINEFPLIQSSIIISDDLTNGWRDIIMYLGNTTDAYRFYVLNHNGVSYPLISNETPTLNYDELLTGTGIFRDDIILESGISLTDD